MKLRVCGAMSGTSADGLDASCLEFNRGQFRLLWTESKKMPSDLRQRILDLQNPNQNFKGLSKILKLEHDYSIFCARSFNQFFRKHPTQRPHVIGNHGQTVYHQSPKLTGEGITWQMGNAALIAERTELSVASQFRLGDLAAGGEGAPMAPLFHLEVFKQKFKGSKSIVFHNLGGFSNVSFYGKRNRFLAFDTGLASAWIDYAVQKVTKGNRSYDRGGTMAKRGNADQKAIANLLKKSYYRKSPPKSTGRDDFPFQDFDRATRAKGHDLIRTATELTVLSIVDQYRRFVLKENPRIKSIYFSGGGAKNTFLMKRLSEELTPIQVLTSEELGWPVDSIESSAFALMTFRSLLGQNISGPWTGKKKLWSPPAMITPGKNWRSIIDRFQI